RESCPWPTEAAPSPSPCFRRPDSPTSNLRASTTRSCASSRTSSCCSAKREFERSGAQGVPACYRVAKGKIDLDAAISRIALLHDPEVLLARPRSATARTDGGTSVV